MPIHDTVRKVTPGQRHALTLGCLSALVLFLCGTIIVGLRREAPSPHPPASPAPEITRKLPKKFPVNTHLPARGEGKASGSIDLSTFSAGRDLVYVDDPRVWWESDHDKKDSEDDHTFHKSLEAPFRRLVELVAAKGGTLEVHDAYRPTGIHNPKSLHKEGRAIDVTCDQFPLEELAKLCWVAGFDWVLNEGGKAPHVHASVRR